jgi:hypothetical protein
VQSGKEGRRAAITNFRLITLLSTVLLNMADQSSRPRLKSTCHCGAIEVIVPYPPKEINECQCTLCRRYAAAWIYYKPDEVTINKHNAGDVKKYIWGDRDISFNFCDNCGCV